MKLLYQLIIKFWFILIISVGLGQELELENNNGETWNVIYASPLDIARFQFDVDGAAVHSAYGGSAEAAGFMMTTNSATVIGFSSSGTTIPPDIGDILVVLNLTGTPTGLSNMEFTFKGCMDDGYRQWSPNFGSPACNYAPSAIVEGECLYNDCLGECGGTSILDECGICNGNNSFCSDCNGIPYGIAYKDACGICVGGNTGFSDAFDIGIDLSYLEIDPVQNYRIPINVSNVDSLNSFYLELDYDSTDIQIIDFSKYGYINNNNYDKLVHYNRINDDTSFNKRLIFNLFYNPKTDCSQDTTATVCEENNGACQWYAEPYTDQNENDQYNIGEDFIDENQNNIYDEKCEILNPFSTGCNSTYTTLFQIRLNTIMVEDTTSISIHNLVLNENPLDITEDWDIIIADHNGCEEGVCNYNPITDVCEYPEDFGWCDCDGNVLDACGECGGDGSSCCFNGACNLGACDEYPDCNGDCDGDAYIDINCGEDFCVGGNTDNECIQDCSGVWNGSAYEDFCINCIEDLDDIDCFYSSFNIYNSIGNVVVDTTIAYSDSFYVALHMQNLPDSLEGIIVNLGFDTTILSLDDWSINPNDFDIEGDLTGELGSSYILEGGTLDTTYRASIELHTNEFYQGNGGDIIFLQFSILGTSGESTFINYNEIQINEHAMKDTNYTSQVIYIGDCNGVFNGEMLLDECLVCGGDGPMVGENCDGEPLSINESLIPQGYTLSQNYPNPFNPITYINYSVPNYDFITIDIINISGQIIKTIVQSSHQPGNYKIMWDGTNYYGISVPSGIYFYKMDADEFVSVKKLVLLK